MFFFLHFCVRFWSIDPVNVNFHSNECNCSKWNWMVSFFKSFVFSRSLLNHQVGVETRKETLKLLTIWIKSRFFCTTLSNKIKLTILCIAQSKKKKKWNWNKLHSHMSLSCLDTESLCYILFTLRSAHKLCNVYCLISRIKYFYLSVAW